jgi:hypothetical protein
MDRKRFLKDSDRTGRFIVKSLVTGKRYFVEPIGNSHPAEWGDLDPATKKMTGDYGDKYEGCVSEEESIITEENGFEKITEIPAGVSPFDEIERRDKEYEEEMKIIN